MLNLIDRYIARLFLTYFLGGLLVFVTIFLAVDFLSFAVRFADAGTDALFRYYLYFTPSIIYQLLPVACLLATVFSLSTLNKSAELIALYSVGMSLARISAPILILVALLSAFSFWLSDKVLPRFEQKKNYTYYVELKKTPGLYSTVTTNKIWYRSENVLFNIKTLDAEASTAYGLTLYYFDPSWKLVQMITAESVNLDGSQWELAKGNVTLFLEDSSFPLTKTFDKKVIQLNEEIADLQSSARASDIMSLAELRKFIAKNKEAGLDTLRYEVDYQAKFGFAFAAFVMSLMGIPFSVKSQRSGGTFLNIGICIGLAFLYWAFYSSSITLGKHGALYPVVAAWAPNLIMLALAIFLLLRLKR